MKYLALVIVALVASGCTTRAAVVTHTADGDDIACTAADFDRLTARAIGEPLEPYGDHGYPSLLSDPNDPALHFHTRLGMFIEPRTCYVVARDPAHLSRDERAALLHEWAHRVEFLRGWKAAAPLWARVPLKYQTHPDILARLYAEGYLR